MTDVSAVSSSQEPSPLERLVAVLPTAETVLVLLPEKPSFDQVAAATGLYLSLVSQQKIATLAAPAAAEYLVEVAGDLAGVDQVTDEIANQELWVHFPFREGQVDKVTYDIDQASQRFWLMVKPAPGQKPLDAKEVEFTYGGVRADIIITVGVSELERLGELYSAYEQVYRESTLVSIGNFSPSFGQIKIEAQGGQALSEVVVQLLQTAAWPPTADAATNLLAGIEQVTDSFGSLTTTAQTLAAASYLMQSGARRVRRRAPQATQAAPTVAVAARPSHQTPTAAVAAPATSDKSVFAQRLSAARSAPTGPLVSESTDSQTSLPSTKKPAKSAKTKATTGQEIRQLSSVRR